LKDLSQSGHGTGFDEDDEDEEGDGFFDDLDLEGLSGLCFLPEEPAAREGPATPML